MRTMTQKRLPLILLWLVLLSARTFAASDAQQRILVEDGRYVYPVSYTHLTLPTISDV